MSSLTDDVARAIWAERERGFPPRVQRKKPDDFDMASGAFAMVTGEARAAIAVIARWLREPSEEMIEAIVGIGNDWEGEAVETLRALASHLEEQN